MSILWVWCILSWFNQYFFLILFNFHSNLYYYFPSIVYGIICSTSSSLLMYEIRFYLNVLFKIQFIFKEFFTIVLTALKLMRFWILNFINMLENYIKHSNIFTNIWWIGEKLQYLWKLMNISTNFIFKLFSPSVPTLFNNRAILMLFSHMDSRKCLWKWPASGFI